MSIVQRVHEQLWAEAPPGADIDARIRELVAEALPLSSSLGRDEVADAVKARVGGLGPLEAIAADPTVSEIMVNAGSEVWVERAGRLERTAVEVSAADVELLVRRLAAAVGRRIDRVNPSVEVRLVDGSRLHAILPPLAIDGPCVTIRRFSPAAWHLDSLASPSAAELLVRAVRARASILVAGGTSSGKTTLLNALCESLPSGERVITIEDAAELRLPGDHIVRLETRAAGEGTRAVGLRELVRHALRMRPDRIVCGEMRGPEALDLVQAMNTGHPGSMSTVHANGAADTLRRVETMMLTADADLPLPAIREQLVSCVDLVVMTVRKPDGSRTVSEIAEVPTETHERWQVRSLYSEGRIRDSPIRSWSLRCS